MPILSRRESKPHQLSNAIHPLLQRVFSSRGVVDDDELDYQLKNLLPPSLLKGLPDAIRLLSNAVIQQQKVMIVGDFDADGATSCALSILALRAMGLQQVDFLVPNRFEYGYGLTPEIVEVANNYQPDLIVTVDNGIASVEGVEKAKSLGIKVLVTDHHLPPDVLPNADAIVNPNQRGCDFPSKNLAGVGVIFYVLTALRTALREQDWFEEQGIKEPLMANYLDLVALGTVADVVPLDRNNRLLVQQGLQRIKAGHTRPGLLALIQVAGKDYQRISSSDFGFIIGPRLNAAGRLDDMSVGIRCLLTDDVDVAHELAAELDGLNRDRRAIESSMQREAIQYLESVVVESVVVEGEANTDTIPSGICLYNDSWHQGVVGIVASRIKEKYYRPVIAFAPSDVDSDFIKGSARSIPNLHIRDVLDSIATAHPAILQKFGGHAMAAGLSLHKDDYAEFSELFNQAVENVLDPEDLQELMLSDGELSSGEINLAIAHAIQQAGPWGQGFPEPLFDGEFFIVSQRIVGEKHLKLVVSSDANAVHTVDAIAFNVDVEQWPNNTVSKVRLAYQLSINFFRGQESVQLMVKHIAVL
ncbi:Single-stranded-DNA-specific exonuclease recJ [gamma proteobacterium IMCC1989]|nr:Single-stranded-DNA-specific exonuclease recJ [gamma proteobacterium IMCC1989]